MQVIVTHSSFQLIWNQFPCRFYQQETDLPFIRNDLVLTFKLIEAEWRINSKCVGKVISIGSDNGSAPGRRRAIIWTNAGIFLIRPLGTNVSEIWIEIHTFENVGHLVSVSMWCTYSGHYCIYKSMFLCKKKWKNVTPTWWRHQMETFSALLALREGNPPVTGGIPLTNASDADLWCFLWSVPEQTVGQTTETPVMWDAIAH